MSKIYEVAFKIGADMASSFARTMSGASGALGELNKQMSAMGNQQAGNKRVIELRETLAKTSKEFKDAKKRAAELGAAIDRSNNPTAAMRREYDQAQAAVQRTREKMRQQVTTLREVSRETGATGRSTADLVAEQNRLAAAGDRAAKAQAALQRNISAQQANTARRGELRGQLVDAVALGAALGVPVKMAMEWEQNLAEFNKVAGKTQDEVAAISMKAQEMAVATGVAREEIMGAYIAAAQAGFNESEWDQYAEVAAKMGVAFDTSGEKAGEMLKAWRSSMGLSMTEAEQMAAAANHIANSMNAVAIDVGEVLQRQGTTMTAAGLTPEKAAAFSAALLSGGDAPEKAATAAKNIMMTLTKGANVTKSEKTALAMLGFHDPKRLASAMQKDAEKTIMMVMDRISKVKGDEQLSLIGQLFGTGDVVGVVSGLTGNLENLSNSFSLVQDKSSYVNSLQEEFDSMGSTTQNQIKKAQESMKIITTTIGEALLPTINELMLKFSKVALAFGKFAQENKNLVKIVVMATAGLIAFKVAAIAGGYAFTFIRGAALATQGAFLSVRTAYLLYSGALEAGTRVTRTAAVASKIMAAAQWVFNAALTANPIGLVIIAIAGLVAAGVALYKYWDYVAAFFKGVWSGFVTGIAPVLESFSAFGPIIDVLKVPFGWLIDAFNWVIGLFGKTEASAAGLETASGYGVKFGEAIAKAFEIATFFPRQFIELIGWVAENVTDLPSLVSGAIDRLTELVTSIDFFESGKSILTTLSNGILSVASVPIDAIKGVFSKMREYLPFSDANIGPFSDLTSSGMAILRTIAEGIKSAVSEPVEAIKGALAKVRDFLPFSDARVGPLSELTLSGARVMTTLSDGVISAEESPSDAVASALNRAQLVIESGLSAGAFDQKMGNLAAGMSGSANDPAYSIESALSKVSGNLSNFADGGGSNSAGGLSRFAESGGPSGDSGGIVINFNQEVNVSGGGDMYEQAKQGASEGARDLVNDLTRALAREGRLSYG